MACGGLVSVNDTLGKTPVGVFLDPDTLTATAVCRTLAGRTLRFEAGKQADGKLAIYDRQTHSRWNIEGKAEEGPLAGSVLDRVENHLSQWYGWVAYFPDTDIYGRRDKPQPGNPFDAGTAPAGNPPKPEPNSAPSSASSADKAGSPK